MLTIDVSYIMVLFTNPITKISPDLSSYFFVSRKLLARSLNEKIENHFFYFVDWQAYNIVDKDR